MKFLSLTAIVYVVGLVYLILPSPQYPNLTGGARSDEPGDTWQHPDQKGFYTNLDRANVLHDIQSQFSIKFAGLTIPNFRLNYRPEEASIYVRELLQSYYLEEIIYPLRESIFVNGWEPKKSPDFKNILAKDIPEISLHGVAYNSKITLKPNYSPVWARILIWTLAFPTAYLTSMSIKKSVSKDV